MARKGDGIFLRNKTWWLDAVVNKVRYQKRLGKNISRSTALELAQVQRASILKCEAGIGKKQKDVTFDDARKKFAAWMQAEKRINTIQSYTKCLDRLAESLGGKPLSSITPWTLEAYRKRRGEGKPLTQRPPLVSDKEWLRRCRLAERGSFVRANRELSVLKTLFNKMLAWGQYEGANPVRAVKARKEPRTRLRFLELAEEARLLAAAKEPLRSLILLGVHTGLRIHAEALQLKWEDVDLRRGLVTVQAAYAKNGRTRSVPLNFIVRAALERMKRTTATNFVFVGQDGARLGSIRGAFRTACKAAGITGATPHTLRHTFASRLVMKGVDLPTVQDLGGWQTLGMVERYSHLSPGHKANAVERLAEFPYTIPYSEKALVAAAR